LAKRTRLVLFSLVFLRGEGIEQGEVEEDDSQDGSELYDDHEQLFTFGAQRYLQQLIEQEKMPCRTYG